MTPHRKCCIHCGQDMPGQNSICPGCRQKQAMRPRAERRPGDFFLRTLDMGCAILVLIVVVPILLALVLGIFR